MNGLVAVVGRPNVGKSTFFNRMAGRRLSIVEDTPGVTRDRLYADVEWLSTTFTLIDTGGIELDSDDEFFSHMRRQAELAVDTADVILFFTDAREGLTTDDREVAQYLRRRHNNIILVVNKVDSPKLDEITARLPKGEPQTDGGISIAVVGKPNAGKSSLVNKLLNQERSIVSDVPGTTRDALDTKFEYEGRPLTIIDTAGIRRKRSIEDGSIERYSVLRSLGAIRRCDVALILIDASAGLTEQDVKIAGYVHEQGKASVVLVNKWDLIEKDAKTSEKFKKQLYTDLAFMDYVDVQFISAKTGQRLQRILPAVLEAHAQSMRRIQTGVLNDVLNDAVAVNQPPASGGRRLKIFYCTQVACAPPTFIIFVNQTQLMHFSYERYLENCFRKAFGFKGTPIKIILRERDGEE